MWPHLLPLHGVVSCAVPPQACRAWLKEEEEAGGEGDVPEEWHLAAAMAGCAGVKEMLNELDILVAGLKEVRVLLIHTISFFSHGHET